MAFQRASGVLLHPTSLPGPYGSGDLGEAAFHFVDWLAGAGQKLWQILPLGGLGTGNSPYMSNSAFAGEPANIDLRELQQRGLLEADDLLPPKSFSAARVDYGSVIPWRTGRLQMAASRFAARAGAADLDAYASFCAEHASWLDDHALFSVLDEQHKGVDWADWPSTIAHRDARALAAARQRYAPAIEQVKFIQWCFFRQWAALRRYAHGKGVSIIGDAPIFIANQSADVWANQRLFELDANGRSLVVAGVPPDYFSVTGQRWGNPLYRWSEHERDGYAWWVERVRRTFELVDIVRIDHFRGFAAYWEIPASEPTAMNGVWKPGPGGALFEAIKTALGDLPIIAEDLGIITDDVTAMRQQFGLPGMRILQFAFNGGADNAYLPHNHERDSVVYTGTHDNDTTDGWWATATEHENDHVRRYFNTDGHDINWVFIRAAMASVAVMAIHPMQDVLGLDTEARMNAPSQGTGCWEWRFEWSEVAAWHAERLGDMARLYRR